MNVCIDIRFWFVAVWSAAESQDCNKTEELTKCLNQIPVFTDDSKFRFTMSRDELDVMCP